MKNKDFVIAYDSGVFGDGDLIRNKKKQLVYTRTLNTVLSSLPNIEEDLEKLVCLKNKYIARITDFKIRELGANQPPLIMSISKGFNRRLSTYLQSLDDILPTRHYVNWVYQAGKGTAYLLVHGIYHKLLSARTCLLDAHGNIKLCDFWASTDFIDVSQDDIWRALPPETLLDNVFTTESLIWTFSHLVWQIFTHCKLLYRSNFESMGEFVSVGCHDEEFYLPGSFDLSEFQGHDRTLYYRMVGFEKFCNRLPRAPESFNRFVRKCLSNEAYSRSTWTEVLTILNKEYRIFKLSLLVELFQRSKG